MMRAHRESPKLIALHTKRHSTVLRRLLQEYSDGTTAIIDRKRYPSSKFPDLIATWCTNECIRATRNFKLMRGQKEVAGFHDTPDEFWIVESELPFVQRLAQERLVRYDS